MTEVLVGVWFRNVRGTPELYVQWAKASERGHARGMMYTYGVNQLG
jgi:hypothetical protein